MSTKRVTISRDPFARENVIRETITKHEHKECAWCGQPAKFRYGAEHDSGRSHVNPKPFCSRSCSRDYNR